MSRMTPVFIWIGFLAAISYGVPLSADPSRNISTTDETLMVDDSPNSNFPTENEDDQIVFVTASNDITDSNTQTIKTNPNAISNLYDNDGQTATPRENVIVDSSESNEVTDSNDMNGQTSTPNPNEIVDSSESSETTDSNEITDSYDKDPLTIAPHRRNEDKRTPKNLKQFTEENTKNKATPRPAIACETKELCEIFKGKGYYRHPDDPTYFFTCENGVPYCLPCPTSKLTFSEKCQMCMENNDDDSNICPTTSPIVTKSVKEDKSGCDKDFCLEKSNGHYANNANKKSFYMCSNSLTYCMDCPAGLLFDEACVRCVGYGQVGKPCN